MTINGTDITMIRAIRSPLTITCEDEDGVLRPFEDGDTVAMSPWLAGGEGTPEDGYRIYGRWRRL